jgi:hypothetical protein
VIVPPSSTTFPTYGSGFALNIVSVIPGSAIQRYLRGTGEQAANATVSAAAAVRYAVHWCIRLYASMEFGRPERL